MSLIERVCFCGGPIMVVVSEDRGDILQALSYNTRMWLLNASSSGCSL